MIGQAYCCEQLTHVCSTTAIQRPQLLLCMQWFRNFDFVKRLNCYNCSQHDHELVVVHSRSASMSACEYCAMLLGRLRCPCGTVYCDDICQSLHYRQSHKDCCCYQAFRKTGQGRRVPAALSVKIFKFIWEKRDKFWVDAGIMSCQGLDPVTGAVCGALKATSRWARWLEGRKVPACSP